MRPSVVASGKFFLSFTQRILRRLEARRRSAGQRPTRGDVTKNRLKRSSEIRKRLTGRDTSLVLSGAPRISLIFIRRAVFATSLASLAWATLGAVGSSAATAAAGAAAASAAATTGVALESVPEVRAELPGEDEGPKARAYKIGSVVELRGVQNQMPQRDPKFIQGVYELSLSGQYQIEKSLSARVNLSIEKLDEVSKLYIKEAYFNWQPFKGWVDLRAGQQFMSVGLFNRMDNFFSSQPEYVEMLFTSTKGIDMGVEARLYPWEQKWIFVEAGQYSGQVLREQDQRHGTPSLAPRFASLKSKSEFYEVFATYFEHHLAFFNPIRAIGAGFEVRGPEKWLVRPRLIGETWAFYETQVTGPTQQNRAYSLYGGLEWWKLGVGMRLSGNSIRMISRRSAEVLAAQTGALYHFDFVPLKALRFRVEYVSEQQQLLARDEWVYRAILNWSL